MKTWLILFALLFALAQFGLWLTHFLLPLPLYIFGGAFLAIASNFDRGIVPPLSQTASGPVVPAPGVSPSPIAPAIASESQETIS